MKRSTLERILAELGDEMSRDYENTLTSLAAGPDQKSIRGHLEKIVAHHEDEPVAYAAFYCLNVIHRRNQDYSVLDQLITRYQSRFADHPSFRHLRVLLVLARGTKQRPFESIAMAEEDAKANWGHAGIVHLYADMVATAAEESDKATSARIVSEWGPKAIDAVNRAIMFEPGYAKFYCTRARLLALTGNFDDATESIRIAIDSEDSSKVDYARRIGNYQYHRLAIQSRMNAAEFERQAEQATKEQEARFGQFEQGLNQAKQRIDESVIRNLEFLGFFAGLISFTIASIQIAAQMSLPDATRLIIVLMGALLVAFAGFAAILERGRFRRSVWTMVGVGAVGAAVIGAGVAF